MRTTIRRLAVNSLAGCFLLTAVSASMGQQLRYEPATPTVSPYLNLFRNDGFGRRNLVDNYYNLVRPMQRQYQVNQMQQQLLRQQHQQINQLQSNLQTLEQQQAQGTLVAPTGVGAWFNRPPTNHGYLNTSRFYSQSGTVNQGPRW